jgi:hypothetical protein
VGTSAPVVLIRPSGGGQSALSGGLGDSSLRTTTKALDQCDPMSYDTISHDCQEASKSVASQPLQNGRQMISTPNEG